MSIWREYRIQSVFVAVHATLIVGGWLDGNCDDDEDRRVS